MHGIADSPRNPSTSRQELTQEVEGFCNVGAVTNADAGRAAFLVGYESVSQFSREYRRQFGAPPQQDVRHVRAD